MWTKYLLLAALAINAHGYLTYREDLRLNKTPRVLSIFSNACDECQIVIKRLADVAKDPSKIAEIKAILSVLCDETSYKDECRIFVSRLDLFFDRLLPYLHNPHEVCHKLHICGNEKLQSYHHAGMFFSKKYFKDKSLAASTLLCDECHFALDELSTVVNNKRYQDEVKEFLSHEVCANIPRFQGICDSLLEDFLPDFWTELQDILKDKTKFCIELKLCKATREFVTASIEESSNGNDDEDANINAEDRQDMVKAKKLRNVLASIMGDKYNDLLTSYNCGICQSNIKRFLTGIQHIENTTMICDEIRRTACINEQSQVIADCSKVFQKYCPTTTNSILKNINTKMACRFSRLYDRTQITNLKALECESCTIISQLVLMEVSTEKFRNGAIDTIVLHLCRKLTESSFYICENLVKGYVPIVLTRILQILDRGDLCYMMHACPKQSSTTTIEEI